VIPIPTSDWVKIFGKEQMRNSSVEGNPFLCSVGEDPMELRELTNTGGGGSHTHHPGLRQFPERFDDGAPKQQQAEEPSENPDRIQQGDNFSDVAGPQPPPRQEHVEYGEDDPLRTPHASRR